MRLRGLAILSLLFIAFGAFAQEHIPIEPNLIPKDGFGPAKTTVKLDPVTRIPIGNIPFDRTFYLRVYFDANPATDDLKDDAVSLFFLKTIVGGQPVYQQLGFVRIFKLDSTGSKYDASDATLKAFPNAIDVIVPALDPNRNYDIIYFKNTVNDDIVQYVKVFKLIHDGKRDEAVANEEKYIKDHHDDKELARGMTLATYYDQHPELANIIVANAADEAEELKELTVAMFTNNTYTPKDSPKAWLFLREVEASAINTQQFTVQTSAGLRIIADGGLIFTGFQSGFNTVTPYLGINIAMRPMDSDLPFRQLIESRHIHWYQRLTVNLGLTLSSIAKANYRTNLFGNDNVMLGFGYKLSHVFNVNFGGLIYQNVDPNPVLDKKTIGVAPYVGVSINLKIKDALGDIAKVFAYGK